MIPQYQKLFDKFLKDIREVKADENDYAEALDEMRDHLDTEYDSVALDDDEVEDDFEDDEEDLDDELEEDELTEEDER